MHAQNSTTPVNEKDEAQTRWEDIRHLAALLGCKFVLDVCATKETAKSDTYFSLDDAEDGLQEDWLPWSLRSGYNKTAVYCNPPFSNIAPWFKKCVEESKHCMVVGCCPNDTSVGWWEKYVEKATFIIVPSGEQARRTFLRPDGREFTTVDKKTGKENLSSPKGPVCFPVWCRPRIARPEIIRSQFPVIKRRI